VIGGLFGAASMPAAIVLVVASLVLIGVCHLPIPMWGRLAILAAIVAGLAVLRAGWLTQDWIAMTIPILASMFMFRLAAYLYDISHGKGPKDLWGRLGYFFMFPNMVLPFFPVVDFATFGRTYYNTEALSIYRTGVSYVLRGLVHLLLYRVVYMFLVLAPDQVQDPVSFLQYLVANFGLYLKISGLFHFVVGILALFGFNLPETHTRFYFANSFIDFWRRINIYWKDFMQKMVFTPSYMQFKKLGVSHLTGVSLSILVVFLATWALHTYQWFWITGTYLFAMTDMLFWAILGVLLIGQTLLEARPKPAAVARGGLIGPRTLLVVRTVCTFLFICLLWSFWTSPTVEDWLAIVAGSGLAPALSVTKSAGIAEWLQTIAFVVAVFGLVAVAMGLTFGLAKAPPPVRAAIRKPARPRPFYRSIAVGSVIAATAITVQLLAATAMFGPQFRDIAKTIGDGNLNRADRALLTRGYYEDLAGEGIKEADNNLQFLNVLAPSRRNEERYKPFPPGSGVRARESYLLFDFVPNATAHLGGSSVEYPINRWGMNDRDYSLEKSAGVFRVAMMGASRLQGLGVAYGQRFETLLEERLNTGRSSEIYNSYELLNFGVTSYSPVQRLMSFEEKALRFQPDAVIYEAGPIEMWVSFHAYMVRHEAAMPYSWLEEINRKAGVDASMSEAEVERRLKPYGGEIASGVYHRLATLAKDKGLQVIWVHIPDPADRQRDVSAMERAAQEVGFATIRIDDEFDPRRFQQSLTNGHPNEAGNKLIADLIYEHLLRLQKEGKIDLGLSGAATGEPTAK
jgi:D-alanyl-lipoteichoic acid acyltransferase DltB (MBOAT superfamily)